MESHHFEITKTARYFQSGPSSFKYRRLCFALHGYGQLPEYFLRPFMGESLKETLFIAPEGLHRFYLEGSKGRVGASWMTREDRLTDIRDYCQYLDQLFEHFEESIAAAEEVGVLGFSQGVATACRWVANSAYNFNFLINYAGAFPPDLNHQNALPRLSQLRLYMAVGDKDEYINKEKFNQHIEEVKSRGYSPDTLIFEGKHKIYPRVLTEIFDRLSSR